MRTDVLSEWGGVFWGTDEVLGRRGNVSSHNGGRWRTRCMGRSSKEGEQKEKRSSVVDG